MMSAARSSLVVRVTLLYALIITALVVGLGAYFYYSVTATTEQRITTMLTGRVTHYAQLVGEMYTVSELHNRPLLFSSMLGAEQDVLVFRRQQGRPVIEVNSSHLVVPDIPFTPLSLAGPGHLRTTTPDGTTVYWAWRQTRALEDGQWVQIVAGHPMTREMQMLASYRLRIALAALLGALAAVLLGYGALRRGLKPVSEMATQAAQISPVSLAVRLDPLAAPSEVRSLAHAFNAVLDRLAAGYQQLSQFSADLAHEIRTPLGVLIGQTQVALSRPRSVDDYQQVLASNLEELEQLHRLCENMLFLAKADHGRQVLDCQSLDMAAELTKMVDYFDGLAAERNMSFLVEAEGAVWANPELYRRALANLLVNAIRHGEEGGRIVLKGLLQEGRSLILVENQCMPLLPEQLACLFDRFYQVNPARSRGTESHGLGLSIVQAIMTLHGGQAWAMCPQDGLVRFVLSFPSAPAS